MALASGVELVTTIATQISTYHSYMEQVHVHVHVCKNFEFDLFFLLKEV